ncbi:hypothetical protein CGJ36_22740 [Vibrio parahaemolyticus]|jgi:hypothetical protein|uniref:protelomerase family protein n=1 Tax=Vibrio parahaemolyticus TaxID=670 RepID=UPI00111DD2CB|nr:protelomerase family protein [Vibrio parahaemolyticus]TOE71908.1 hypothetical protein CGJ36_22740 [Vibrio parahaemolyticus]
MSGESRQKVNLEELINELVEEVKTIDDNEAITRSEKTKLITRAATKFKTKLHDDKRRKDATRIALSTYRKYMTMARAAVTEQNWKHHSLEQQIERLAKKHPQYAEQLVAIGAMDNITELRLAHRDLLKGIKDNDEAFEDIRSMKLDHEVMRHLTLPSAQKARLAEEAAEALTEKKTSTVDINYHELMAGVVELLTKKTKTVGSDSTYSFSRLALGIGLATGRRSIEILKQGEFKKVDEQRLEFSGQAKKRGGADYSETYTIYTLVDSDLVLMALKNLRELPEVRALDEYDQLGEIKRNDAINKRCAKTLNQTAKQFFSSDERVFKDSRAIWARLAYELFFQRDPRWKKKDEDVFWQEMLGHEDIETQKAYKQFKVDYSEPEQPVHKPGKFKSRAEALAALDSHEDITTRSSMAKIHDWVKERIAEDPEANITQSLITRELGSGRKVIKDYLDLADDALAVVNTPVDDAVVEVPADVPAAEKQPKKAQKPRLVAHQVDDEHWEAWALVEGEEVARVKIKGTRVEAMTAAWEASQKALDD